MVYIAKWKVILILAIGVLGLLFASPNLLDRETARGLPSFLPNQQINLGLDLQGGAHMLLEVEVEAAIKERLEAVVDGARGELRTARIRYTDLGVAGDAASVTIRDPAQVDQAYELIRAIDQDTQASTEGNRILVQFDEQARTAYVSSVVDQALEIVRRRIDEMGTREPTIQRQGAERILVQVPGLDDPKRLEDILGQTAKMTFHLVDLQTDPTDALSGRVPPGSMVLPSLDEIDPGTGRPRTYVVKKRVMLSGENLVDARQTIDQRTNQPVVSFRFDGIGGKKFAKITTDNVGKPFAIVLDNKVISAPRINEPILGGSGIISGNFTVQSANDLALLLRAGALPAPLTILEQRTVGPGLGADSIAAGKVASLVGLVLVIVFMGAAYGRFGLMADVALMVNMILIAAALSVLQATLTLPGIAGIVLTIGMAVDANVLIFERIREEARIGRTPIAAIDAGYQRALSTIIDANVTTLIAAILLFSFGSGPVRGFAVTLAIGIVTSMFTAIMVTRLMVVTWLRAKRPSELPI